LQKIYVEGEAVYVCATVFTAFKQLCQQKSTLTVWIDVIYINQRDLDERHAQVSLMGDIFADARTVFCWLGEGTAETDFYFDYINDELEAAQTPFATPTTILRRGKSFARLSYWQRRWIIPEIILAKGLVVQCGSRRCEFGVLSGSVTGPTSTSHWSGQGSGDVDEQPVARTMLPLLQARERFLDNKVTSIYQHLVYFARFECADQRDRLFALRSVAAEGSSIRVDYSLEGWPFLFHYFSPLTDLPVDPLSLREPSGCYLFPDERQHTSLNQRKNNALVRKWAGAFARWAKSLTSRHAERRSTVTESRHDCDAGEEITSQRSSVPPLYRMLWKADILHRPYHQLR
jgi:hypothetical protein